MPMDFITDDGFGITQKCKDYLYPLIQGEAYPPYKGNGMPDYVPQARRRGTQAAGIRAVSERSRDSQGGALSLRGGAPNPRRVGSPRQHRYSTGHAFSEST